MGRNILYVTNYYLEDVIAQRHSKPYISQAAQNKGQYIIDMLECGGNHVTVWSNAWTNSRSLKFYKGFRSRLKENVYYSSIFGAPGLNALSCFWSSKRFLKSYVKKHKIDIIIFYNMRLENSKLALYAKKRFGIPIVLQYEDGLTTDASVHGYKRLVYRRMEEQVLNALDAAFLVNSKLEVPCPSVVIRGAIREDGFKRIEEKKESSVPELLFASTLDEQRGIGVLLEALKYTDADFVLNITGRGEAEEQVRNCKDARVRFLGYLDYATYKEKLAQADICINAQLAHHAFGSFSFPSKIFEYLSAGKLVISSDVADAKEALGDTLLIYENDDPKCLAHAIDEAVAVRSDAERKKDYEQRIAAVIKSNSMESIAENVNRLFDRIGAENDGEEK